MDELVAQLAAKAGVDIAVAAKTAAPFLGFLRDERRSTEIQTLIDATPGTEEAIEASNKSSGTSQQMGGGFLAPAACLVSLGLGIGEIEKLARELFRYGHDKIEADRMGVIIAGTPGLRQFA